MRRRRGQEIGVTEARQHHFIPQCYLRGVAQLLMIRALASSAWTSRGLS